MSLVALPSFSSRTASPSFVDASSVTLVKPIIRTNHFGITSTIGSDVFVDGGVSIRTSLKPADVANMIKGATPIALADSA